MGASVNTTAGTNVKPASVGVTPVATSTNTRTPGKVSGPELSAVTLTTTTDAFGTKSTSATYTFDKAIGNAAVFSIGGAPGANTTAFHLYDANGNQLNATACNVPSAATATNTQVICTAYVVDTTNANPTGATTVATDVQNAVAGTADYAAVTGTTPVKPNPEGYAATTGGTGTPAA